jgi:hypothetical protein
MKFPARKILAVLFLTTATLGSATPARAGGDYGYGNAFDNPFFLSVSSTLLPFLITALENGQLKKLALAQQVSEDAAVFYQTGELTGILPGVIRNLRNSDSDSRELSESEAVDRLLADAEELLSRSTN